VTAEAGDGWVRLSWGDVSERGLDPVINENDFEGYRIYRATDPEFRDPRIIVTGTGSNTIGNGRPIAQFDLVNERRGYSEQTSEGVAYYLGSDSGVRHTWTDSTVTNGQEYYYAVCAYDYGPKASPGTFAGADSIVFYPSENSIAVSKTLRGGFVPPKNVAAVRPGPKVLGYTPAATEGVTRISGDGFGTVAVEVVNSDLVPDDHLFAIRFLTPHPDSLHARAYILRDSTKHETIFATGRDLIGEGSGPTGQGLFPVISTLRTVEIDSTRSGWTPESDTDARFDVLYQSGQFLLPINLIRPGFPDDLEIVFADTVQDTTVAGFGSEQASKPVNFKVIAQTDQGDRKMKIRFYDIDPDGIHNPGQRPNGLLDLPGEYIEYLTASNQAPNVLLPTWWFMLADTVHSALGAGDTFRLYLKKPFSADEEFVFRTRGQRVADPAAAGEKFEPYVVPNPYVGAASFEPERFAVSGRGERRIEFRGLPRDCVTRVYTVRGDLVQTLRHGGSNDGFLAWNLRTKDNLDLAPGLYIYHVDGGSLGTRIGKFGVVK
jgi:hypothetical protein